MQQVFYNHIVDRSYSVASNMSSCLRISSPLKEGGAVGVGNFTGKQLCGEGANRCILSLYLSDNCSGKSIGTVSLDAEYGVFSLRNISNNYTMYYETFVWNGIPSPHIHVVKNTKTHQPSISLKLGD